MGMLYAMIINLESRMTSLIIYNSGSDLRRYDLYVSKGIASTEGLFVEHTDSLL